jgi:MoaA/NifB/PqqE/SkfB family radical SAM enzyme
MKPARALLFPSHLAVLTEHEGAAVSLADFLGRSALRADGMLGRELLGVVGGAEPGPAFTALGRLGASAMRLRGAETVALTPAAALRLEGFDTLFLELTLRCTERCVHCYAEAGPERTEALDLKTCLSVLEDARSLGFRRVQLTGGDPLLSPHVEALLVRAGELGFETREIFTNGLLLDEERLRALAPLRPSFAFSLYSAEPAIHDAITGVPGSHQRTCDAIARAVRAGLEVRAATVVLEQNAAGIEQTLELARALGASVTQACASHGVGRGRYFDATTLAAGGEGDPAACGREEPRHLGTLCVAGDGSVFPCVFNRRDRLGSVHERPLWEIVESPELPAVDRGMDEQMEEARRRLQCVSCQCTAFALHQIA